jgi:hypothetical protein
MKNAPFFKTVSYAASREGGGRKLTIPVHKSVGEKDATGIKSRDHGDQISGGMVLSRGNSKVMRLQALVRFLRA